jgi:probable phosphoglycerate mutase
VTGVTVYFVRHGETAWNAEGRLQGQQDVPLNDRGRRQAEEAGVKLRGLVADAAGLDYLASPMHRTRDTMERLRAAIGLDRTAYGTDERLRELTFGGWEGRTWREVRRAEPEAWAARERDKWGFVPPGGESYAMLADRVMPVFAALSRPTVVVSHGGVARALLARACGVPIEQAPRIDIWQGRVLVIEGGRHRWV